MSSTYSYDAFVVRDNRTGRFFGGGKADELFSYWIEDWRDAKQFESPADFSQLVRELMSRDRKFSNDPTASKKVLHAVPLFDAAAYSIHKVTISMQISPTGETLTS